MRGTQSFVHVMAEVFRRPSLTGIEMLWRWVFWIPALAWPVAKLYPSALEAMGIAQTSGIGTVLQSYPVHMDGVPAGSGLSVASLLVWLLLGAAGRYALWRKTDAGLQPPWLSLLVLGLARWLWWAAFLGLWAGLTKLAVNALVLEPQSRGAEAEWIVFAAVQIVGTLAIFLAWLATSWVFGLASVFAARLRLSPLASVRRAWQSGPLRGKIAEINLVMGIVKIALLVLAMVFTACPLPFQDVETQGFLLLWTLGVLLLYCVASDYFHVVRLVAFLRMSQVFDQFANNAAAPGVESAS